LSAGREDCRIAYQQQWCQQGEDEGEVEVEQAIEKIEGPRFSACKQGSHKVMTGQGSMPTGQEHGEYNSKRSS